MIKKAIFLAVLMAVSSSAWALGEQPQPQSIGAGTNVVPVTGKCGGGYSQGQVATPQNIRAAESGIVNALNVIYFDNWVPLFEAAQSKNNAVRKDLTQGLALDVNTAMQKIEQAKVRSQTYADEQTPPGMPCGSNGCTGQQMMSAIVAGSGGVMGSGNAVSGAAAQATAFQRGHYHPPERLRCLGNVSGALWQVRVSGRNPGGRVPRGQRQSQAQCRPRWDDSALRAQYGQE